MPRQLSYEEYQQTFQAPMQDVTATADAVVDLWAYVDAMSAAELNWYTLDDVKLVYRRADEVFEHVLIATEEDKNVFLVVVINRPLKAILGHHLLNLGTLYGLEE